MSKIKALMVQDRLDRDDIALDLMRGPIRDVTISARTKVISAVVVSTPLLLAAAAVTR